MLFKIAWRNVWRNRTRSLVVIASVSVGLFAGTFMAAFYTGVLRQEVNSAVRVQLSHIQIHNPAFLDDKSPEAVIPDGHRVATAVAKIPCVEGVSERVVGTGMVSSATASLGVEIHGIAPGEEKRVSALWGELTEGDYFSGDLPDPILIGQALAAKLGVRLHSKVVITLQQAGGDLTAGSFRVEGIFRTANSIFDQSTVFTRREDLARLMGIGDGIHEVAVLLKDPDSVDAVAARLARVYPADRVETWKQVSPQVAMMTGISDEVTYILLGIILLALMCGIVNTMLMAVLERRREIGVLMAVGMNKRIIFFMIVLETILLTGVGVPVGVVLAGGAVGIFGRWGIDLSAFGKGLSQFGVSNTVYPAFPPGILAPLIGLTALAAILAALYPAWKALQLRPAEAIHKI